MKLFEFETCLARYKHRLQTSVRCISARQSYLCYIFYEIADNDIIYCKLELAMFLKLKCVINISILMMKSYFHIIDAVYNL